GAVVVEAVDRNRGRALQVGMRREKVRNRETGALVIVLCRAVMFRLQIVIEKDRIVRSRLKQLFRVVNLANNVQLVALEAFREPLASALVILEQKNTDRMSLTVAF